SSNTGAGGAGAGTGVGGGGGMMQPPPKERATISGDITWQVTFDATAQMGGATDCAYTRHYEGVQDDSAPWLCPSCEIIYRTQVEMTAGLTDCYPQVSEFEPAEQEWIGYGNGAYFRGLGVRMSEQGTAAPSGEMVVVANQVTGIDALAGGTLGFDVSGQLTVGSEEGDPLNGFEPPSSYECGWPKADPPPYAGNHMVALGQTVPDGLFKDACEEAVRLHDFAGSYLFVDMSAMDCPPCQQMAQGEEAFVGSLAQQGIDVHVVTLLAPSLSDTLGETTTTMLDTWKSTYGLQSPVLADRGWGLTMFIDAFGGIENTGYPSWVIVAPDLTVIDMGTGFGTWDDHVATITAHAN
ncbi:MAG: redoxin domain-containing protein, partial [Myxococcales bacterium]|nr:redoxin domain-containing protein [Myxococcales bacterium]